MSESQSLPAVPKKFEYEPLDLSKQQIRLLTLHSALSKEDPIECRLEAFDTDSCPEYVALSYVWGPPSPTRAISVNGQSFVVRQNLFDFLLIYRDDSNNTNYIWIDQICISQAHTAERNHQVQLMSIIYTKSLWTLSWLGWKDQEHASLFVSLCPLEEEQTLDQILKNTERHGVAKKIISGNYFRRLWIIQEILLAPAVRVLCGSVWMKFKDIISHANVAIKWYHPLHNTTKGWVHALSKPSRSFSLIDSIEWFHGHECQDSRDKIYGLTGLIREKIVVDYSKTAAEVFLDVILALAKSGTLFDCSGRGSISITWHTFYSLLKEMGLKIHALAFENLWLDLRDNHKQANQKQWILGWERYPGRKDHKANWRVSSEWTDDNDRNFDDRGCVLPFSAIGFAPGKDEMLSKWWYTWRGVSWFYVLRDWQDERLPSLTRWNPYSFKREKGNWS